MSNNNIQKVRKGKTLGCAKNANVLSESTVFSNKHTWIDGI